MGDRRYDDRGGYGRYDDRDRNRDRGRDYRDRGRDYNDRGRYERRDDRERGRDDGRDRNARVTKLGGGGEKMKDAGNFNNRIYITGLPPDITEEDLAAHFGPLGKIAKKKQRRGYPDQWPYKISIYTDDSGKCKGDAALTYEDPNAAQTAPEFFNGSDLKGSK
mmetsp:Transcript_16100/g.18829  ORF Transcript_16100/g.18829 Transcript_16100/m.18829 type:complete len:163 (-) Transcript_16100:12-500(-)